MNNITVIGNITKAPEAKRYGDLNIAKFTIASNEFVKGKKETDFFYCSAFGKDADNIVAYCDKGSSIAVVGTLRSFKGDSGVIWTVNVEKVKFLSMKEKQAGSNHNDFVPIDDFNFDQCGEDDFKPYNG